MSTLLLQTVSAFCITILSIVALAPIAARLGLVDKPNERKLHNRDVPLVGGIALLILFAGIVVFKKETTGNSTSTQTVLNEKIKEDNSEDSLRLIPFSQNKEFEFDEKSDSSKSKLNSPDSILNPALTDDSSSKPKIKNKTNPIKESKNANSKSTKISYKRKVRLIKSLKQVPDKYKGELYSENDLVDFYGGNKNLEKELLNNFKGKIKDTHIPKENTSIVFKFSVTSNGKIKDINIQSRVNIELEKIIKYSKKQPISENTGVPHIFDRFLNIFLFCRNLEFWFFVELF